MTDHIVSSFDAEMKALSRGLVDMGERAVEQLRLAVDAFDRRDLALAAIVRTADAEIDELYDATEQRVLDILALRNPVAIDLREVVSAAQIAREFERIGDYAKNIAKRVARFEKPGKIAPLTLIPAMAEIAQGMVHDVLDAYGARDAALAVEVIRRDEKVDNFYDSIFRNLVSHMMESPSTISDAAQLLFVARNLERIGDHSTNVAEMVYFAATGEYCTERDKSDEDDEA